MEKQKKIKRNISEKRLVNVLRNYLRRNNYTKCQVRHYEKRIDLVMVCSDSGELCAIEAKTENWKRAIEQAVVNLAVAERSYIAIYSNFAHRVSLEELDKNGIGLISVGTKWGDVKLIKEADSSPFVNLLMNERLKQKLLLEGTK